MDPDLLRASAAPAHVIAVAGSLRARSFNRALLEAARELAPAGFEIEPVDLGDLPFYNADVEAVGDPPAVARWKARLQAADGLLIATPEYNDGIPGVLTTALDWASRTPGHSPLAGKPVAIIGAAAGQVGTARAQLHLRTVLQHTRARVLPPPELLVGSAAARFDADLRLVDERTREILAALLRRFAQWIARERAADAAVAALPG